ncbi:MAG: PAS domain-containing protein [Candidatus Omnitrophota bacterium]|nr:PAS domain-containing protein [Candidatus Omnitrophota bacterium]MBU1928277.1 PAS domain-containing protein [Candidatus Omnitrophota bacterium]MBU2035567.1 PAS domain-containing protein [Candidatus Omnitrophota bacterium]MBU2221800.1 PAS domain-containing protein [Candidatus Omnitrophota bacterium]MBU2258855.1 PAS domain-containing protein [Candidatus Omnitrophota bacterium]
MAQEDKTKEELIEEIKLLQKRIAEFEILDSKSKQQQDVRRLATVVRDSNDAVIIQEIDGRIIAWNRGAELMYGYSEKEALGMNIECLTTPEKIVEQKELTRRLMAGEMVVSFETQRITKDGNILDVWLTVTKLMEHPTDRIISTSRDIIKPIGFALVERNITERKKAEDALKESEEKFRIIFDNANDGILLADEETKFFYTGNNTICQMLGYSSEEIKNLGVIDIHPKEDLPYILGQFERQVRKEIAVAKDLPVKRKNGSVFYADVSSSIIILAGRTYLLEIFRDVTERKKTDEEAQKHLLELEIFYKASIGREERIMELKKQVAELEKKLKGA